MSLPKMPWKVYWINLERRKDRYEHMKVFLKNTENERISAIDGKNNYSGYKIIEYSSMGKSEHGCTASHIKAMNYYLNNSSDKFCFIAEDDCYADYCPYWQKKHMDILVDESIEILQMSTTVGVFNDANLEPQIKETNVVYPGTAFYLIRRDIAKKIVDKFMNKDGVIDLSNERDSCLADILIWRMGLTKLLPMICLSTIEENPSDVSRFYNKSKNNHWKNIYYGAREKYLNYWKNLKISN